MTSKSPESFIFELELSSGFFFKEEVISKFVEKTRG
jgi:hypothetical protein